MRRGEEVVGREWRMEASMGDGRNGISSEDVTYNLEGKKRKGKEKSRFHRNFIFLQTTGQRNP
jgi:hypothetical protein